MAFTTRLSLLSRVRKGDEVSWGEFYQTYKPLIKLCGNDCMLTPTENEDLVQQVMCEIFQQDILNKYKEKQQSYFKYDQVKGKFRHYLKAIIRNHAVDLLKKRSHHASLDDEDSHLKDSIPDNDSWERMWDQEWQKHIFSMALQELKDTVETTTYLAFEMYALQHRPIKEVTDFLQMKESAIYVAKNRCLKTMQKIIAELEDQ